MSLQIKQLLKIYMMCLRDLPVILPKTLILHFFFKQESDKKEHFQHFRAIMNSLEWLYSFHVFLTYNGIYF